LHHDATPQPIDDFRRQLGICERKSKRRIETSYPVILLLRHR
jgi:hypothetical protein